MKNHFLIVIISILAISCQKTTPPIISSNVIASDIDHFWEAYDVISNTTDSLAQVHLLDSLFIAKGTPGLTALMEKRRYTTADYLYAINNYPQFWASIRANTKDSGMYAADIESEITKLKDLYPDLRPAKIYFTIGAMMSNGTTLDSLVLIGSELAMGDSSVVTDELAPEWYKNNLTQFFSKNPIENIVLLNVHEYVHTQQNTNGYDCLSQCLYEGVAEFVSVTSSKQASVAPALPYGKANETKVIERFKLEIFSPNWDYWLYNSYDNEFEMRDLGYFVGYAICEKYYEQAEDKALAIKEMIELDFGNQMAVEAFVEASDYFNTSLAELKKSYEAMQPELVGISQFENGSTSVNPTIKEITFEFSKAMSDQHGGFGFGELGEEAVFPIEGWGGISEDGKRMTYKVNLQANKHYQRVLQGVFRSVEGPALVPILIDFTTGE